MLATSNKIVNEALSLPTEARVDLVAKLLASLNLPVDKKKDRLWAIEAERRITQLEKGKVKLVAGEKVFGDIAKKHKR